MAILSPFFVLFFCNPGHQSQIMARAASIYVKLRSLARGSSPQWCRRVRVCRLAYGLAYAQEFARKRRYSWVQPYRLESRLVQVESTPRVTEIASATGRVNGGLPPLSPIKRMGRADLCRSGYCPARRPF